MKLFLGIAAFLVLFLFWACNLGPEDEAVSLNLVGEEAWRSCHTLDVVLLDGAGNVLDTLFSDSLASLDQLERLSARKYTGGKTKVHIRGIHKDGAICVDQLRTFEEGGSLVVDTLVDPAAAPRAVTAIPGNVSLVLNGDEVPVEGRIAPVYADQGLYWSMDSSGVAALDVAPGTVAGKVRLRPVALGEGFLTLRSRKDPARAARVRIHVSAVAVASVTLDNDSLLLYVGGPGEGLRAVVTPFRADPKVTWSSADPRVARVDAEGLVSAVAAGRTWVRGVSGNGKADSALIVVLDDIPRLVVNAAPGAPVNVPLVFRAHAVQRVGYLAQYAWDFQGDGVWDDSLPGPWFGDSVRLPEIQGAYGAEGGVMASFRVKDSEGNVSYAEVPVEVGNQPPLILGMPADTVVSINDSIPLQAIARDQDGGVAWVGWDYEGDGAYDDSLDVVGAEVALSRGRRFNVPGNYLSTFRAVDGAGKARTATARVQVELDAPTVDAGRDTSVLVGGDIRLAVRAFDGFGTIQTREISIGNSAFSPIAEGDITLKAPNTPGTLSLVARVTDDDGLQGLDTVHVTVLMSNNADLAGLALSTGTLLPAFSPGISAYSVRLPYQDSVLAVTATARDIDAVITALDRPLASGVPSAPIAIPVGATSVPIHVVSPDGSYRTYTLSVTREPSADATLRNLVVTGFTLRPAFGSTVLEYADTVPFAAASATIRPFASNPEATIRINGDTVPTSTARTYPLQFGENRFTVTVVAMDTAVRATYTLRVVRRAKLYVYRKLGAAAPVLADSAELPPGTSRPFSIDANGYHFARWMLQEGAARFADSLANPTAITVGAGVARVQAHFELNSYTISALHIGCGILRPGTVTVAHGGQQTYEILPNPDCRTQSVLIDGQPNTATLNGSYTFTNVTSNHTIQATFVLIGRYSLSGNVVGGQGSIEPAFINADSGSTHTFRFRPAANYRLLSVQDGDRAVNPTAGDTAYTLTNVAADHQLRVRFLRRYTLTVQQSGCGTVTSGTVVVDSGVSRQFSFNPTPGCKVDSVFVNHVSVSTSGGYTFENIGQNNTLRVVFVRPFTVTTNWGTNGSNRVGGLLTPTSTQVDSLDDLSIGISPAFGYRLSAFRVGSRPVSPLPVTGYLLSRVASNQSVTATFQRTFRVLGRVARGKGIINPATLVVDSTAGTPFTFQPDSSYRYHALTVDGMAVNPAAGNTNYFLPQVMRESTTVAVSFWKQYTITTTPSGCGVIAGEAGAQDSNSTPVYHIRPNAGCRIQSLKVDGDSLAVTDTVVTFPALHEDHTVAAVFRRVFRVTTLSNVPGAIRNTTDTTLDSGSTMRVRWTTPSGYRFTGLKVNDVPVEPLASEQHDFPVQATSVCSVLFVRQFQVTGVVGSGGGGTVTPTSQTVDTGGQASVTVQASQGYRIAEIRDSATVLPNDTTQPTKRTVTLENIVGNRTVMATFEQLPPSTFLVSASSATPDLGLASPPEAKVAPGSNHVVSFEALNQLAFTQSVEVNGSTVVAFNSGDSSYALPPVWANQQVVVTFVSRNDYSLLTLSTTAFQGSSATPPQLCLGNFDWKGCSEQGKLLIRHGMLIGDTAQVNAPESICPIGDSCSNDDRMYFQHWQDQATNSKNNRAKTTVRITKDDLHLVAVYASRGNFTDSLTVPPVLPNQGAGTSQGN